MNEEKKGFKLSNFETDEKKEVEGVWHEYAPGFKLRIARANNPKSEQLRAKLLEPHIIAMRHGKMDADVLSNIVKEVYAKTILVDWEGMLDEEGNEIPYNLENALKALDLKDFFDVVHNYAESMRNYKKVVVDEAVKN